MIPLCNRFGAAFCLASLAGRTLAVTSVDSASTLTNFMGYYLNDGKTETMTAAGPWTTQGTLAGVCESFCNLVTNCNDATITYSDGNTAACGTPFTCVTLTIYESQPFGGPSATNIDCRIAWSAYTIYREIATTTSTSSSSSSSASTSATKTSGTTSHSTSPTSSPSPTTTSTSSKSKGWIAGAVVGPIAGVALIAAAIGFFVRRQKTAKAAAGAGTAPGGYAPPPENGPAIPLYGQQTPSPGPDSHNYSVATSPNMSYAGAVNQAYSPMPVYQAAPIVAPAELSSTNFAPVELPVEYNHSTSR